MVYTWNFDMNVNAIKQGTQMYFWIAITVSVHASVNWILMTRPLMMLTASMLMRSPKKLVILPSQMFSDNRKSMR